MSKNYLVHIKKSDAKKSASLTSFFRNTAQIVSQGSPLLRALKYLVSPFRIVVE